MSPGVSPKTDDAFSPPGHAGLAAAPVQRSPPAGTRPPDESWPERNRTFNGAINSRVLCQLSYRPTCRGLRLCPEATASCRIIVSRFVHQVPLVAVTPSCLRQPLVMSRTTPQVSLRTRAANSWAALPPHGQLIASRALGCLDSLVGSRITALSAVTGKAFGS